MKEDLSTHLVQPVASMPSSIALSRPAALVPPFLTEFPPPTHITLPWLGLHSLAPLPHIPQTFSSYPLELTTFTANIIYLQNLKRKNCFRLNGNQQQLDSVGILLVTVTIYLLFQIKQAL